MAAKSITVPRDAASVLASLAAHAGEGRLQQAPLQNGTRVRLSLPAGEVALNVYPSKGGGCKVVFDRPESAQADAIAALLGGEASAPSARKAAGSSIEPVLEGVACWAGSDESGKGDYFGPLVVAAVVATRENWRVLETLGVRDSKGLTDTRARALAGELREAFPNRVVTILPPAYNRLWEQMGSVNRVLAWAHARAFEDVLEQAPEAVAAVADQFGDEQLIHDALFRRGRAVRLVQMPRAERDPAVAAASLLARAEFLRRLDALGRAHGARLPKGASPAVESTARALVAARGPDVLTEVAKRHFRTTQRVLT